MASGGSGVSAYTPCRAWQNEDKRSDLGGQSEARPARQELERPLAGGRAIHGEDRTAVRERDAERRDRADLREAVTSAQVST